MRTWTLKPKLWTSQIWTLIHLINNFVIVTVCAKSSKLITLEENKISVQQSPLCLPLFFLFSSEVLNSGIKNCFDGVVFLDAVCEECFINVFVVFPFSVFCYCFYEGFISKIILHLRHIAQYIYAIVFKRIFWNNPTAATAGFYHNAQLQICSICLRLVISSLKEIQYFQSEPGGKGTYTNKSMMLKMFYLYGFFRWTKCIWCTIENNYFLFYKLFEFAVE